MGVLCANHRLECSIAININLGYFNRNIYLVKNYLHMKRVNLKNTPKISNIFSAFSYSQFTLVIKSFIRRKRAEIVSQPSLGILNQTDSGC